MAAVRVFGYDRTNNIEDSSKDSSLEVVKEDCAAQKNHYPIVLPTVCMVQNHQVSLARTHVSVICRSTKSRKMTKQ